MKGPAHGEELWGQGFTQRLSTVVRGGEEQPCTAKGKSAQVVQSEERVRRCELHKRG